ncbi:MULTISPECIES: preprotein translocase subunit SecE [unclassified Amycolatopsis]|uniref:preprotein translocase subunit SecE n=1 Tax=unclassified Amycolatopsis TaxID=2618356 RepID=UPI001FF28307|nr:MULTISPECIES: preprotein translocase subunit SecE [unclassified Amycolatopsis]UOZ09607.1 preprotein translocase subunit SecE [Amycolatopsis sp. WQ 127309]WSJ75907.1 preprotein translocase subunit SecE [Amycolatopsis sp. NBC_01307]WSK80494.1 preprotein translocase subunit SecE [Amycolatopsis sp. NBC_01286]
MVVSDSDASGGEQEQDGTGSKPESQSRPVTAAARRERRATARPAGKSAARADDKARPAGKSGEKSADAKGAPTPKRDQKPKKASVFARLVRFVREVWAELRKVIWPNRKQMVTYTAVVLVFVVFMVALVSGLDLLFKWGIGHVFG